MKTTLKFVMFFLAVCGAAGAQAVPAGTTRALAVSGTLNYDFRYSQTAEFTASLGNWQMSTASASATYANGKDRLPLNLQYSGGYTWTIAGPSYGSGLFQHLLVSQGIVWGKWNLVASDDISYLPEAPTTGFSGIPGIGEPIGNPIPTPPPGQSILTLNTHVVENDAQAELGHNLNYSTMFSAGGKFELFRYPDNNGIDMNTGAANATFTRRLNARNSLTGRYVFSKFGYPKYDFSIATNSGTLGIEREWNRKVNTDVSAGPQYISSTNSSTVPSSLNVTANASVNYHLRLNSASVAYSRGVNGGAGFLLGAELDAVTANLSHDFGKKLTVGAYASYLRTAGLGNKGATLATGVTDAKVAGGQATKRLGRYFTAFANYTATTQSSSSALPINTLNQLIQVVGFGIGYSPRGKHLRQ